MRISVAPMYWILMNLDCTQNLYQLFLQQQNPFLPVMYSNLLKTQDDAVGTIIHAALPAMSVFPAGNVMQYATIYLGFFTQNLLAGRANGDFGALVDSRSICRKQDMTGCSPRNILFSGFT